MPSGSLGANRLVGDVACQQCWTPNDADFSGIIHAFSDVNIFAAFDLQQKLSNRGVRASACIQFGPAVAQQHRLRKPNQYEQLPYREHEVVEQGPAGAATRSEAGDWNGLPLDVVGLVMSHLSDEEVLICAAVSSQWRSAIGQVQSSFSLGWVERVSWLDANRAARFVARTFSNLRRLDLTSCTTLTDAGLAALTQVNPHLTHLSVARCSSLTDAGICDALRSVPRLEALQLRACSQVSDAVLVQLNVSCARLTSLDCCSLDRLTDAGLCAMAGGCRNLSHINLGWCESVTDVGIQFLAACCPQLQMLDLCGCRAISDEGIAALSAHCPHLSVLGLHCLHRLTDAALFSLARCLSGLKHLNISGCVHLTSVALQAVLDANPQLHTCAQHRTVITGGAIFAMEARCACPHHVLSASGTALLAGPLWYAIRQ